VPVARSSVWATFDLQTDTSGKSSDAHHSERPTDATTETNLLLEIEFLWKVEAGADTPPRALQ